MRRANKVSEIPLMVLWSAAVNKVEKQPWRHRGEPIRRIEVKRRQIHSRAAEGDTWSRINDYSLELEATAIGLGVMA